MKKECEHIYYICAECGDKKCKYCDGSAIILDDMFCLTCYDKSIIRDPLIEDDDSR